MEQRYEKILARIMVILLILSLLPVMYLGRYNHPSGDDYYYGVTTYHERLAGGNLFDIFQKAAQGAALEYRQWQGTYSAMFLMYLPPNIWGDAAYRIFTTIILLMLTGSIFYCLKPAVCIYGRGTFSMWLAVSAAAALLCVETVPSQGETFFWYNGSMYYTGFFSAGLIFLGLTLRQAQTYRSYRTVCLLLLAVFLAGGNYVSLLPIMILTVTLTLFFILKKRKKSAVEFGVICAVMLGAFAVNALAPGNAVRQSNMWKIPAWKAILKSLLQGGIYLRAWLHPWWLAAAVCLTPVFWRNYGRSSLQFRRPLVTAAFTYGVFCSMSCPLFYTMNSTGPARAVAIVYYGFILSTLFIYYYLLGALHRYVSQKDLLRKLPHSDRLFPTVTAAIFILLMLVQLTSGAVSQCTSAKAILLLANGEAKAYEEEYRKRLLILKDPAIQQVEFESYTHQPDMLYVGDFTPDSEHPTNQQAAKYFKKESISTIYE